MRKELFYFKSRFIVFALLLVIIMIAVISCSGVENERISHGPPEKMTIAMYYDYSINDEIENGIAGMRQTFATFEGMYDIEIEFVILKGKTPEEYSKSLNNMMNQELPVDMVVIPNRNSVMMVEDMIENEIVADMSSYISSQKDIIEGVHSDYFFPCAMYTYGSVLRKDVAKSLGYKGDDIIYDKAVYKDLYLKWLAFKRPVHDSRNFSILMSFFMDDMSPNIDFEEKFEIMSEESYDKVLEYASYISDRSLFDMPMKVDYEDIFDEIFYPSKSRVPWYLRKTDKKEDHLYKGKFNPFDMDDINENIKEGYLLCTDYQPITTAGIVVNQRSPYKKTIGNLLDMMYSQQMQYHLVATFSEAEHVAKAVFSKAALEEQKEHERQFDYKDEYIQMREDLYDDLNEGQVTLMYDNVEARSRYETFIKDLVLKVAFGEVKEGDELRNKLRVENNTLFMMVHE